MQLPPLAPRRPHNQSIALALVGGAILAVIVAAGACAALLVTRTQADVLTIALDDVQPGSARLVPLARFGADEMGRTHGLWVVRPREGVVLALLTVDPHSGCRVEWRADQRYGSVSPILRDPCTGSIYDAAGVRLFGPAPRGLDRVPAVVDREVREISIDLDRRQSGPCSPGVEGDAECAIAPAGE